MPGRAAVWFTSVCLDSWKLATEGHRTQEWRLVLGQEWQEARNRTRGKQEHERNGNRSGRDGNEGVRDTVKAAVHWVRVNALSAESSPKLTWDAMGLRADSARPTR